MHIVMKEKMHNMVIRVDCLLRTNSFEQIVSIQDDGDKFGTTVVIWDNSYRC